MPDPTPDDMGGELWAKQAPARPDKDNPGAFPDAIGAKVVKKAAKKAAKKKG